MSEPAPRRVRVSRSTRYGRSGTDPSRTTVGHTPAPDHGSDAEVSDPVADVYVGDLRRAQLRWALASLAVVAVPLFSLPLVLAAVPALARPWLLGLGVGWVLLAAGIYPLLWLAARWFVTGAERLERDHLAEIDRRRRGTW